MSTVTERPWTGSGLADADAVCAHLDIGRTLFDQMAKDGRFGPMPHRLGRAKRFDQAEVDAWIRAGMPRREIWAVTWGQQQAAAAAAAGKKGSRR